MKRACMECNTLDRFDDVVITDWGVKGRVCINCGNIVRFMLTGPALEELQKKNPAPTEAPDSRLEFLNDPKPRRFG